MAFTEVDILKDRHRIADLSEEIDRLERRVTELLGDVKTAKSTHDELTQERDEARREAAQYRAELGPARSEALSLQGKLNALRGATEPLVRAADELATLAARVPNREDS